MKANLKRRGFLKALAAIATVAGVSQIIKSLPDKISLPDKDAEDPLQPYRVEDLDLPLGYSYWKAHHLTIPRPRKTIAFWGGNVSLKVIVSLRDQSGRPVDDEILDLTVTDPQGDRVITMFSDDPRIKRDGPGQYSTTIDLFTPQMGVWKFDWHTRREDLHATEDVILVREFADVDN